MHRIPLALALAMSVMAGPVLAASAMPRAGTPDIAAGPIFVPAGGCHADTRTHFVPEFGRSVPHRHRRDCAPVAAEAPGRPVDCHRDAREHFVPGYGRVYHRHVGPDCEIRVIRRSSSRSPD